MGVSKNRGILPPKWMVNIMENPMNKWMIWGYIPLFLETPTCSTMFSVPWIFQWKGVESMVPEKKDLSIYHPGEGFFQEGTTAGRWKLALLCFQAPSHQVLLGTTVKGQGRVYP